MSELCGFVYNKGHQKSRENTREIWLSEGAFMYVFCLSCPSATFALQHGGFAPHEWLAAEGQLLESSNRKLQSYPLATFSQINSNSASTNSFNTLFTLTILSF